jgi:two-component system chemotaxis response regulator CheB
MSRMDGLTFLEKLMHGHPMPVVMISSLTERDSEATFRALELGAVDFVAKPKLGIREGMQLYAEEICYKLKAASMSRVRARPAVAAGSATERSAEPRLSGHPLPIIGTEKIIAIGASTGGTEAIKDVLLAYSLIVRKSLLSSICCRALLALLQNG